MTRLIRAAKSSVLEVGRATGLLDLVRDSRWRSGRLLILAYHGISLDDEHEWDSSLYMSPACFEERLRLLKRGGYTVLPFGEASTLLRAGRLPRRSVTLTFDDGTYDFYRQAFPLLQQYGYPATVYLTTYYCEFNRPVFNVMGQYLLWKGRARQRFNLREVVARNGSYDLSLDGDRARAWAAILDVVDREHLTAADKDALAERLAGAVGIDYEALRQKRVLHLMNAAEVAELAGRGVDFQLHTHRHRTPTDRALFEREIADNRACIEQLTRLAPQHFCYPSGLYRDDLVGWLATQGVATATTCDPGLATPRTPPLLLPRYVDTMAQPSAVFEGWLSGAAAWLSRHRSYAVGAY